MPTAGRVSPARLWRAFFFSTLASIAPCSWAGVAPGTPGELAQIGKPNPAEAARLVEQFRNSGIPGDYFLEFELRALPRRGEGKIFKGRWWGSRNDLGAVTRIEVTDDAGRAHRFLLQNGERPGVWRLQEGRPVEIGIAELMAPLVPGVEISAFDLQMPYLYWPAPSVEKITRVLGRPSNAFIFPAPAGFKAQYPDISSARAYLDTQFNVPMQSEIIGRNGKVTKTWAVLSLKTVNRQTVPKSVDYRNEVSRDKTRLLITGVGLNLQFSASTFQPSSLTHPLASPPAERVIRIDP
jgi:hypothetical protein